MGEKAAAGAKPDLAATWQTQLDAARPGGRNERKKDTRCAIRFSAPDAALGAGDAAARQSLPVKNRRGRDLCGRPFWPPSWRPLNAGEVIAARCPTLLAQTPISAFSINPTSKMSLSCSDVFKNFIPKETSQNSQFM